jgi:hypothetical protein
LKNVEQDIVEERRTTQISDYVTKLRDADDIILIEHDEQEEEEETFNVIENDSMNDEDEEQKAVKTRSPHLNMRNPRNSGKII